MNLPSASVHPDHLVVIFRPPLDAKQALRSTPPAARAEIVNDLVGDVKEVRLLRCGWLVIHAVTEQQVISLLQVTVFNGVLVSAHRPFRFAAARTGVIMGVSPDTADTDIQAALSNIATGFARLRRRTPDGQLLATWSIKATFSSNIPEHVIIGQQRFKTRPFTPAPVQCFQCFRFGHTAPNCRSSPRCGKCSDSHLTKTCVSTTSTCALCGCDHPAWSRECAFRRRACEVERVRVSEGLSYADALRRIPPPALVIRPPKPVRASCTSTQTESQVSPTYSSVATQSSFSSDNNSSSAATQTKCQGQDSSTEPDRDCYVFTMYELQLFLAHACNLIQTRCTASLPRSAEIIVPLVLSMMTN